MTGRSIPEWSSDNPDAAIPRHVQARIVMRQNGLCALTGAKLKPGGFDFDHELPLCLGGRHAENNLRAIVKEAHKAKTADDVKRKAKADRQKLAHWGLKKKRGFRQWRGMNGEIRSRDT